MEGYNLYEDIQKRTNGEIYVGVVGPVRTGKSTFIRKFMELFVLPNLKNEYVLKKTQDELPQGSAGTTIMTTEPKFIPNESVMVEINEDLKFNVKMIDCVGYLVDGSTGHSEDGKTRLVNTPWNRNPIPFSDAAIIGTEKVITDHSTLGIIITTDGSVSGIPRENYIEAEEVAIGKLKAIGKPFIILLNVLEPNSEESLKLAMELEAKHKVTVIPINALTLSKEDINEIFETMLYQFSITEVTLEYPKWIYGLDNDNWLKASLITDLKLNSNQLYKIQDIYEFTTNISDNESVENVSIDYINLGSGRINLKVDIKQELFYDILTQDVGIEIKDELDMIKVFKKLVGIKREYDRVSSAMADVESNGYGVVVPRIEELTLEEPEIIRQGNRYGVKLMVKAPSIHMIQANVEAEVAPIVGTEEQSKDLLEFLKEESKGDMSKIWSTNVFGKSLHELISDELESKLNKMDNISKDRLQVTLQRVINEGNGNLICIII